MKRTLPPIKLEHSPLVLVLCQVRFSPILAMGEYFPKIQDRLRLKGYPLVNNAAIQETIFTPTGMTTVQRQHWRVQDKSETSSIIVTESFIAVQTTAYAVFEDFLERVILALDTVAAEVKELFVQRIGLRYVDLVRPPKELPWTDYVRPGLQGIQSNVFTEGTQTQLHQSVAQTARGSMIIRLIQNRDGQTLPPDLIEPEHKSRLHPELGPGELLTILDLDHFSAHQKNYDAAWLRDEACLLHDDLDRVFRESLFTPAAFSAWN